MFSIVGEMRRPSSHQLDRDIIPTLEPRPPRRSARNDTFRCVFYEFDVGEDDAPQTRRELSLAADDSGRVRRSTASRQ